jgi:hypothetical protein
LNLGSALTRQRSEPDAIILNESELTGPVGTTGEGGHGGPNNPSFLLRTFQDVRVTAAGSILANPRDVVAIVSKGSDNGAGNVLVGEQPGGHVHRERRG